MYCNAVAVGNIAQAGNSIAVNSPTLGAVFICGYSLSNGGTALTATIGYGTGTQGIFTSLTQGWALSPTLASPFPFVMDTSSVFRGLYVPPGNAVLVNESTTGTLGYSIHYIQQTR
jgi:hypothetical protein